MLSNYRYDEFLGVDQAVLIQGEVKTIPANSPYYVALNELPRTNTLLVRNANTSSALVSSQDCSVFQGNASANDNTSVLKSGRDSVNFGSYIWRAFLQWDLSSGSLPTTASSVKLRLAREAGAQAPTYAIHRVTSSWSESGPTWNAQPSYHPVSSAQFSIQANQMGWYEADITSLYNGWKAGTWTNYGICLRTDEAGTDTISNFTSNSGSSGQRPQLVIVAPGALYTEVDYTIAPAPSEFACHYGTGRLRFNASDATKALNLDYLGLGSPIDVNDVSTSVPGSSSAPGRPGQIAMDTTYFYACVATNSWRRVALNTF